MSKLDPNTNTPVPVTQSGRALTETKAPRPLALIPVNGTETTAPAPPALSAGPTATSLLHSLRRRWLAAFLIALIGSMAAVAAAMEIITAPYRAAAIVNVTPPDRHHPVFQGEGEVEPKTFRDNQEGIVKSSDVLNDALNRAGHLPVVREQTDGVTWLRSKIKTDYKAGPTLLSIHVEGDNAEDVQLLTQAVAEEFVNYHKKKLLPRITARENQIKAEFEEIPKDISKLETQLKEKFIQLGVKSEDSVKAELEASRAEIADLNKTKGTLTAQKEEILSQVAYHKKKLTSLPPVQEQIGEREMLVAEQLLAEYKSNLITLDKEIKQIVDIIIDSSLRQSSLAPKYKERERLIQKINDILVVQQQRKINEEIRAFNGKLTGLDLQIKSKIDRIHELQTSINQISMGNSVPIVEQIKNSIKLKNLRLEALGKEQLALEAAKRNNLGIYLMQNADLPKVRDRSRQIKYVGAAGLGMFGLLLFGVVLWEFRFRKINTVDDVVKGLGIGLVGTLPALPNRARQPAPSNPTRKDLYWQSLMTESIDAVRTMMLHAARTDNLKIVMVTSAVDGEGKTSVASQLAASLARAWKKTLLIDGDLRSPAAHRLFNQPLEPGFSEVLRGEVDYEETIHPTPISRLWMMPAGQWDSYAVQALAQDGLKVMFERFKEQYDFIVIDSCPVLPVADSLLLGQQADAVVLTVLRDVSRAPSIYAAQQRLSGLGIRSLGAIVIGTKGDTYSYPYPMQSGK
jgi:succinoglycan biosynthesis transport protein ExoP